MARKIEEGQLEIEMVKVLIRGVIERRPERGTLIPLIKETMGLIGNILKRWRACCVSDASVKRSKKAVAVWLGTYQHRDILVTK